MSKKKKVSETMIPPIAGQLYANVANFSDSAANVKGVNETITTDITQANVMTSLVADSVPNHRLVLDIDMPVVLVPSSTPGHFHLIIDHVLSTEAYFKLLHALAEAGIVEPGFVGASEKRGYTSVRLPWIKKEEVPEQPKSDASIADWDLGDPF